MRDPARIDPIIGRLRAYWPRWITARRLSAERQRDPVWLERMERLAAHAGFNLQLDEAVRGGESLYGMSLRDPAAAGTVDPELDAAIDAEVGIRPVTDFGGDGIDAAPRGEKASGR